MSIVAPCSEVLLVACRFDHDAPDQPVALTTFEDIATRQELQEEEQEGLDHTVRSHAVLQSLKGLPN